MEELTRSLKQAKESISDAKKETVPPEELKEEKIVEQKLYSFPKDLSASISNARLTIRDVSNLLMG